MTTSNSKKKDQNMITRIIAGVVGGGLVIGLILTGKWPFFSLLTIILIFSSYEFYMLANENKPTILLAWSIVLNVVVFFSIVYADILILEPKYLFLPVLISFFIFIIDLFRKNNDSFSQLGSIALSTIYLAIPLALFFRYSFIEERYSYQLVLTFFFILWTNDSLAYFTGKYFGKHKLFERISPKKTWEGAFGGMIGALIIAAILHFSRFYTYEANIFVIAIIISIFGVLGDLIESRFKRSVAIKDSGSIIPGHGGFLDRFDGLFVSMPFVYAYILFFRW